MSDETDDQEREYGPEDFDQHPVEVEINIPPEAWEEACERYHAAQEKESDAELIDFVKDLIDIQYDWKILSGAPGEASADPSEDSEQWEEAGRALLNWAYAKVRDDITTSLDQLSMRFEHGEPIQRSDVSYLRRSLEDVEFIAEQAATVCPDTEPYHDWTEVLGQEAVEEFGQRIREDEETEGENE